MSAGAAPPPRRGRLRAAVARLLAQHATPGALAVAVGVGVFIGASPLFGLQMVMCVAVAWLLRLNQVAVLLAAQISVPPMIPLLVFTEVQLGARLLEGRWLGLGLDAFRRGDAVAVARSMVGAWALGSVLVGGLLGLVAGGLAFVVARRRPADRALARLLPAQRRAAARYAAAPPRERHYVRWKYRLDPGYRAAAVALLPVAGAADRVVLDLGCGRGLLLALLAEAGAAAALDGRDWDEAALAVARGALGDRPQVHLAAADLAAADRAAADRAAADRAAADRAAALPPADGVALLDVLHYHPEAVQDLLLARAAAALRPGGRLVVRETDAGQRLLLTRLFEAWGRRCGWHRVAGRFHYRRAAALVARLEGHGLQVTARPAGGLGHRANVLLVAARPAAAPPAAPPP